MAQILRPDGDNNSLWTCSTGTSRYALIDEATASDTDYIYTSSKRQSQILTLTSPPDGTPGSGQLSITFRAKGSTTTKVYVTLMQGTMIMLYDGATAEQTLTTSYTNYTQTFTPAVGITDWTDLVLTIRNGAVTGTTYCSHAYLSVPDVAIPAGLEMGMMF